MRMNLVTGKMEEGEGDPALASYHDMVKGKSIRDISHGFTPEDINLGLFDFQRDIVRWACQKGRAAIFADTGLGKTAMQCVWADLVSRHTDRMVLILAPLCVAQQTVREAEKFGISVHYCRAQSEVRPGVNITNYEMMDKFDLGTFGGVVLDESSILKSQDGKTRTALIEEAQMVPYRLSCTATPSPNDHMELGNQAEFLGVMSTVEMLAMFFTHDGGETSKWRLKGHGKTKFWEWLSTWAIVIKRPSDLGYDDEGYDLPGLTMHEHIVDAEPTFGELFVTPAAGLLGRNQARRESVEDRVAACAELINESDEQWIVWCHLNDESDALEAAINGAKSVKGSDSTETKEARMLAFTDGSLRVLVTKPSIAGFGMNWQHCHQMAFVGLSDSWEQYYQAIRRCYRFGQTEVVNVHIVSSAAEGSVVENIRRKEAQSEELSQQMAAHMRDLMRSKIHATSNNKIAYLPKAKLTVPQWIRSHT